MAEYRRWIARIFSYEKGIKKSLSGLAWLETYDGELRLKIEMKIPGLQNKMIPVYFFKRHKNGLQGVRLGELDMQSGSGKLYFVTPCQNICRSGLHFLEMNGIILYMDALHYFGSQWDEKPITQKGVLTLEDKMPKEEGQIWFEEEITDTKNHLHEGEEIVRAASVETSMKRGMNVESNLVNSRRVSISEQSMTVEEARKRHEERMAARQKRSSTAMERTSEREKQEASKKQEIKQREEEELAARQKKEAESAAEEKRKEEEARKQELARLQEEARQKEVKRQQEEAKRKEEERLRKEEEIRQEEKRAWEEAKQKEQERQLKAQRLAIKEAAEKQEKERREEEARRKQKEEELAKETLLAKAREQEEARLAREALEREAFEREQSAREKLAREEIKLAEEKRRKQEEAMHAREEEPDSEEERDAAEQKEGRTELKEPGKREETAQEVKQINAMKRLQEIAEREEAVKQGVKEEDISPADEEEDTNVQAAQVDYITEQRQPRTGMFPWMDVPQARSILDGHPHMYPFEDGEIAECVRIEPNDIGMFPMDAWTLGNNSFIRHAYFNYRHLLFAKKQVRDGCLYLLMVPGVYNPREKHMARMFGFDFFKCVNRKNLRVGEFGYWYLPINFQ